MGGGILNSCESLDDMGFGGIRIIQKRDEFCYGVDAVLLADFAGRERREPEKIIDLGAGTGAVSLILSHKYPQAHIVETEIQKDSADRAARSAALNMAYKPVERAKCAKQNPPAMRVRDRSYTKITRLL